MKKIVLLLGVLCIISCGQNTPTKNNSEVKKAEIIDGWAMLDDQKFSIQYPKDWELNQTGQMGTTLILLSPQKSDEDQFRENVNYMSQDLTGQNIDLEKFTNLSLEQIKSMITNSNIISSELIKSTPEYQKVIYTGDQGIYKLKFEQYYYVIDNKAHFLTLTAEQTEFDKYKETGEKILNSFILK